MQNSCFDGKANGEIQMREEKNSPKFAVDIIFLCSTSLKLDAIVIKVVVYRA